MPSYYPVRILHSTHKQCNLHCMSTTAKIRLEAQCWGTHRLEQDLWNPKSVWADLDLCTIRKLQLHSGVLAEVSFREDLIYASASAPYPLEQSLTVALPVCSAWALEQLQRPGDLRIYKL